MNFFLKPRGLIFAGNCIVRVTIKIYHECELKICPEDHHLASQGLPSDDIDHMGRIFLSHLHTNNGFFFLQTIKYGSFIFKKGSQKLLNTLGCDI